MSWPKARTFAHVRCLIRTVYQLILNSDATDSPGYLYEHRNFSLKFVVEELIRNGEINGRSDRYWCLARSLKISNSIPKGAHGLVVDVEQHRTPCFVRLADPESFSRLARTVQKLCMCVCVCKTVLNRQMELVQGSLLV